MHINSNSDLGSRLYPGECVLDIRITCAAFILERVLEERVLYSILSQLFVGGYTTTFDRGEL